MLPTYTLRFYTLPNFFMEMKVSLDFCTDQEMQILNFWHASKVCVFTHFTEYVSGNWNRRMTTIQEAEARALERKRTVHQIIPGKPCTIEEEAAHRMVFNRIMPDYYEDVETRSRFPYLRKNEKTSAVIEVRGWELQR